MCERGKLAEAEDDRRLWFERIWCGLVVDDDDDDLRERL
jgi:hypothetical protein